MLAAPSASWTSTSATATPASRFGSTSRVALAYGPGHPQHQGQHHHRQRAMRDVDGLPTLPTSGITRPPISGKSPYASPASWPVTHEPSSIWAKTATPVRPMSHTGSALRCPGIGPCAARSAIRMVIASTVSAMARCAVTSSRRRPWITTWPPSSRLHDDQHAGHHRRDEQQSIATPAREDGDQRHRCRPGDRPPPLPPGDASARSRRGARSAAPRRRSIAASPGSPGPSRWRAPGHRPRSGRRLRPQRRWPAWRIGSRRSSGAGRADALAGRRRVAPRAGRALRPRMILSRCRSVIERPGRKPCARPPRPAAPDAAAAAAAAPPGATRCPRAACRAREQRTRRGRSRGGWAREATDIEIRCPASHARRGGKRLGRGRSAPGCGRCR